MIVAYNKDWQFPAITEKHAFKKATELLGAFEQTVYVGFPWATLIDLLQNSKKDADRLLAELDLLGEHLSGFGRRVTVCQHIHLRRFEHVFNRLGLTDVFWAHTQQDEKCLAQYPDIRLRPFPLYPVNVLPAGDDAGSRRYLYSFIGARSNHWYLSNCRNLILDNLSSDDRAMVKVRDGWHFNKIVYGHQINREESSPENLIDTHATSEFQNVLANSVFSLCPSGTGSNSIRLWESLGSNVIPVILSERYLPPGNQDLWDAACVFCAENEEDIRRLPERLQKISGDRDLMATKRGACRQLWSIYGPECFIYDIVELFLKLEQEARVRAAGNDYNRLAMLDRFAFELIAGARLNDREANLFVLSFVSNVLLDAEKTREHLTHNASLAKALKEVLLSCPEATMRHARKVFQSHKFDFV